MSFKNGDSAIFKNLSISIRGGEFVCILGANGSGKTTLARLMVGELRPSEGRIQLRQGDGTRLEHPASHIAFLPQDPQDPPFISVRELVTLAMFRPGRSLGLRISNNDKELVEDCLARCSVDSLANRHFGELSGGEKQRVWLAFCLAQQREFLLLDESLASIDYPGRDRFFQMLAELSRDGQGVLLITHDLQMAERHCHRALYLGGDGQVHDDAPGPWIYTLSEAGTCR